MRFLGPKKKVFVVFFNFSWISHIYSSRPPKILSWLGNLPSSLQPVMKFSLLLYIVYLLIMGCSMRSLIVFSYNFFRYLYLLFSITWHVPSVARQWGRGVHLCTLWNASVRSLGVGFDTDLFILFFSFQIYLSKGLQTLYPKDYLTPSLNIMVPSPFCDFFQSLLQLD